jgi:adenine deaminase
MTRRGGAAERSGGGRRQRVEAGSLLLRGGRLLDVFTGDVVSTNVLLGGRMVLEVGPRPLDAVRTIDLDGAMILPGFIDGHIHLESSLLTPRRFAEAVVPSGTTTVVADPHEIANVLGLDGVRWMLGAAARLPLDVMVMAPSCVPASTLETTAARLDAAAIGRMLRWRRVIGLAEVMDVPGVLAHAPHVMRKIALARRRRRPVDGHAPGLSGAALDRYVAAGIASDHECVTAEEARAKLARGMRVMIREGSQARNLGDLARVVDAVTVRRCLLVTDDRNAADLARDGHVDHLLRAAVAHGIPPLWAVQMVTLNAAEHAGLAGPGGIGAIAPGWQADLAVVDDLASFTVQLVVKRGSVVAERGRLVGELPAPSPMRSTMAVAQLDVAALRVAATSARAAVRVIGVVPGQIRTDALTRTPRVARGAIVADPGRDLAKLVVVDRHTGSGRVGRGLVHGFGLARGALASSIAHDAHNLVAAGVEDADILAALRAVESSHGGLAAAAGGATVAHLALPVAGLMSDAPLVQTVEDLDRLETAARSLGSRLSHPFGVLSFLALPVVPALRLTDRGLVDVARGALVPLVAD